MRVRFGPFELDEERLQLRRDGAPLRVRPMVFDLLVHLVRNRDRVVRREDLIRALWGRTAIGPGSLSGLVNELRRRLGESGRGPSSIRTVHARGYQFVARVEPAPGNTSLPALPDAIVHTLQARVRAGELDPDALIGWLRDESDASDATADASRPSDGAPERRMRRVEPDHTSARPPRAGSG